MSTSVAPPPPTGWRARFRNNPMWGDALCMVLVSPFTFLGTLAVGSSFAGGLLGSLPFHVIMALGFTLPLLWRRSRPDLATAAIAATHLLQLLLVNEMLPGNITAPMMVYAVAVHSTPRRARAWLALALAGCFGAGVRWGYLLNYLYVPDQFTTRLIRLLLWWGSCTAVVLAAWFMGQWARQRRLTLESLQARADALERERTQGMRLVAEEERNRLAREMHDIVAHSLSVIVVQSDGAGYLAGHSELGDAEARLAQVTRAIETIGDTARTALAETRRLVGVLRQDGETAELAPAATLDQIGNLVEQLQQAGVPASFEVVGSPDAHVPLGSGAEMAAYRVVQESLTNVMKHAGPGATVQVWLAHWPDGIELRVRDTGKGTTSTDGMGHGVVGMRERVAAWGGSLSAGPRLDGGFEVRATIPAGESTQHPGGTTRPTPENR